jgi:tRNA A-37 threonylcarbamoyl transferase component Bud32
MTIDRSSSMSPLAAQRPPYFFVPVAYRQLMNDAGLSEAEQIWSDPRIVAWRSLPDRQNCTMDVRTQDEKPTRLHIKRYRRLKARSEVKQEAEGIELLQQAGIPTTQLVAAIELADGRGALITEDLAGYEAGDKLVASGWRFDSLFEATADLAARLHEAGLHHRDLYLCHFFVREGRQNVEVRLIDAARVARLPRRFFRQRWVVKDLAQFWYSLEQLSIDEEVRRRWLRRYAEKRALDHVDRLESRVRRKASWIARHDARLNARAPTRNVSLSH